MALHSLAVPPGGGKTRLRRLQRLLPDRLALARRLARAARAARVVRVQQQGLLRWKSARLKS